MIISDFLNRLEDLCNTFSPWNDEGEISRKIHASIINNSFFKTDTNGNIVCFKKGKKVRSNRVAVCADMRETTLKTDRITPEGLLHFMCTDKIRSDILMGAKTLLGEKQTPSHVVSRNTRYTPEELRNGILPANRMYLTLDIPKAEITDITPEVGEEAAFAPGFTFFKGHIVSKALDTRWGCALLTLIIQSEIEYDTFFIFRSSKEFRTPAEQNVLRKNGIDFAFMCTGEEAGTKGVTPPFLCNCFMTYGPMISAFYEHDICSRELINTAVTTAEKSHINVQLRKGFSSVSHKAAAHAGKNEQCVSVALPVENTASPIAKCALCDLENSIELIEKLIDTEYTKER